MRVGRICGNEGLLYGGNVYDRNNILSLCLLIPGICTQCLAGYDLGPGLTPIAS